MTYHLNKQHSFATSCGICCQKHPFNMSVRAIDFSSSAYAKTKSFKAKENNTTASRTKEKNPPPSGVKSSWTPLKQDLNEKVCVCAFMFPLVWFLL